jgi:hypothetical protein
MTRFLAGLFIILHGLVHLWYFTLSRGLVEFKPDMGWSGESWLPRGVLGDSTTRTLAAALYLVATIALVVSGLAIFLRAEWWQPLLLGSAVISVVTILLFWDGEMQYIVQKGLLGLLIGVAILVVLLTNKWSFPAF